MPFALVWAASTSGKEVRQSPTIFEWPTCFAATQYSHVYRERLEGFSNEYMPYMFRKIREYELQKSSAKAPATTHRVPGHSGQRTHGRQAPVTSLIMACQYEKTWRHNTMSGKVHIHYLFTRDTLKNPAERRQRIGIRTGTPIGITAVSAFSVKYTYAISSWTDSWQFPEPAYQESIFSQGYKRRLDLLCSIFLSSTFPHNSERTAIANCIF